MQIGVKVAWRLWNGLSKVWSAQKIVIALGVLVECWRKNSCFPFLTGVGISGRCNLGLCQVLTYNISISNHYLMNSIYAFSNSFSHNCASHHVWVLHHVRERLHIKVFFFFFFFEERLHIKDV